MSYGSLCTEMEKYNTYSKIGEILKLQLIQIFCILSSKSVLSGIDSSLKLIESKTLKRINVHKQLNRNLNLVNIFFIWKSSSIFEEANEVLHYSEQVK